MMTISPFSGINFWVPTLSFLTICLLGKIDRRRLWVKNSFMVAVSVGIIFFTVSKPFILLPLLLLISLLVYGVGNHLANPNRRDSNKRLLSISIIIVTSFLCYFKYTIIQQGINNITVFLLGQPNHASTPYTSHLFFIGVSYFSFKFIHFLLECYKKKIQTPNLLTFINFIFFFPSFFSGPINRYNSFAESISTSQNNATKITDGLKRIINGLFKSIVIANALLQPYTTSTLDINIATHMEIIISLYAFGLYAYFNFSGYTDMAIGCGKIVGINLPENFNKPFFQRNLQKFWANWHMSLTSWLTDYIYWPFAKKLRKIQRLRKKPVTISNISIFLTFVICGVWHGDGLNFILWGAFHGIGLIILNGYTFIIKKYATRKVKKFIHKSPIAYAVSNFITFQYVSLGFVYFVCNTQELQVISQRFLGL